jgi:hypothetical protein
MTQKQHSGEYNRCPFCMTPPGTPVVIGAEQHYRAISKRTARNEKNQVMRDMGLVRVRGALGGIYWE